MENERKDSNIKIKSCMATQYFEYYDVSEIAVIEQRVKELTNIKRYAMVIHDNDLLESGKPKKRHFHIVMTFSNATTIGAVARWLHLENQYIEKIRTTTKSAMLYLVHRNDPEKFQYNPENIVANFDYVEYVDDCPAKQKRENIASRIINWEIKQYNLHKFVSADEYARNKTYYTNVFIYRQQQMATTDRKLECVFISWPSGCGKTTYSKMVATQLWYNTYISSGGKNPLDNYEGQECIILDDIRPSSFEFSDLLKLTDNNTNSLVGCRFYNKSILECKMIIITSTLTVERFVANIKNNEQEEYTQLFRRFQTNIELTDKKMNVYAYDWLGWYSLKYEAINPVAVMFNKEVASDFSEKMKDLMQLNIIDKPF